MFSCLGRIGCLVFLVIAGALAFLTRERWMPRVVGERSSAPVAWEAVSDTTGGRVTARVESLGRSGGPAYVTLSAAELAALMVENSGHGLPPAFDSVEAAIDSQAVRVRALVRLEDIRGLDALGPLTGLLNQRERIELTGTLGVIRPGLGELRVASVRVADIALPRAAIPRLLARLDSTARPEGVSPDGIAITIPEFIGDVRVARGQVTLYRRVP